MSDIGTKFADKRIRYVDSRISTEYRQAEKELNEKLADFVQKSAERDKIKRKQRDEGIISEQDYKDWLAGQVFIRKRWESKVKQASEVLHTHNLQANKIIHEGALDVFKENYNFSAYTAEMGTGVSFDLINEQAVINLTKKNPQLLPEWKIDEEKDYKWNYRKANNSVMQGIIQGESVDKIAKRMAKNLCTQNKNKMRLFARTAITGAQNGGRQAQMEAAEEDGIEQKKEWVATLDGRTRDSHRRLDGQQVGVKEPFDGEFGKIMFPGDPTAHPAEVYNCRCAMITVYPKYAGFVGKTPRRAKGEYTDKDGNKRSFSYLTQDPEMYEKWKNEKKSGATSHNANLPLIEKKDGRFVVVSDEDGKIHKIETARTLDKTVERIELGELFNETQAIQIAETLEKLQEELPLDKPLQFVGDIRIERGLPLDVDITNMQYEYPQFSGFAARFVPTEDGKGKIWVAAEGLNTEKLVDEFDMRHMLREKYMDANGMLSEVNAFATTSDTIEGTIDHEYIHAAQEMYFKAASGGASPELSAVFNELNDYLDTNKERVLQISKYATTHPFEMVSEAYVQMQDVNHPDTIATKTAKEIWGIFEKHIRRR